MRFVPSKARSIGNTHGKDKSGVVRLNINVHYNSKNSQSSMTNSFNGKIQITEVMWLGSRASMTQMNSRDCSVQVSSELFKPSTVVRDLSVQLD